MNQNSKDAYNSIKDEKTNFHRKIRTALQKLNKGSFRMIAKKAGMRDDQVWRRLSEMERMNQIERVGSVIDEKTKRNVTLWQLTKN